MSEIIIPIITSIGGGFVSGILVGYFLKKIIKITIFVVGGIVGLLMYLQQEQIILLNVDKLEHSSTFILNSVASSFDKMTQIGDTTSLGIPLAVGLSAGLAIGLMKG
ncbi:MAG: FUN14 domain-containing protein [Nitrososphaeraceae archaeon]